MYFYVFTTSALRDFKRLSVEAQKTITRKLDYLMKLENPLVYSKKLVNLKTGSYRFRIQDYRVTFDLEGKKIRVLSVGHRREIYR